MERKYHPTARSPELLVRILRIYPILESLLSVSHRPDITHLAQTCKALREMLISEVPRLLTLFRCCNERIRFCESCNTVVCKDCVVTTLEPEKRGLRWGDREYALVGGHTEALRQEIVSKLRSMNNYLNRQSRLHYQARKDYHSCKACHTQRLARRKPRDWLTPTMVEREFHPYAHIVKN